MRLLGLLISVIRPCEHSEGIVHTTLVQDWESSQRRNFNNANTKAVFSNIWSFEGLHVWKPI